MIRESLGFRVDRHVTDLVKRERETLPDGRIRIPMRSSLLNNIDEVKAWLAEQGMAYELVQTLYTWDEQTTGSLGFPFVILDGEREVVLFMVRWH